MSDVGSLAESGRTRCRGKDRSRHGADGVQTLALSTMGNPATALALQPPIVAFSAGRRKRLHGTVEITAAAPAHALALRAAWRSGDGLRWFAGQIPPSLAAQGGAPSLRRRMDCTSAERFACSADGIDRKAGGVDTVVYVSGRSINA
ncbi:hypothetical protein [Xanthomonas translucens]|nr:hypothetical protein [Xanthomonas translucens]MCT8316578.1 hypothetical protein [Xanthomonas translucens pv. undulosa]